MQLFTKVKGQSTNETEKQTDINPAKNKTNSDNNKKI